MSYLHLHNDLSFCETTEDSTRDLKSSRYTFKGVLVLSAVRACWFYLPWGYAGSICHEGVLVWSAMVIPKLQNAWVLTGHAQTTAMGRRMATMSTMDTWHMVHLECEWSWDGYRKHPKQKTKSKPKFHQLQFLLRLLTLNFKKRRSQISIQTKQAQNSLLFHSNLKCDAI